MYVLLFNKNLFKRWITIKNFQEEVLKFVLVVKWVSLLQKGFFYYYYYIKKKKTRIIELEKSSS